MHEFIEICVFIGVLTLIFSMRTESVEWFIFYSILSSGCLTVAVYLALGEP